MVDVRVSSVLPSRATYGFSLGYQLNILSAPLPTTLLSASSQHPELSTSCLHDANRRSYLAYFHGASAVPSYILCLPLLLVPTRRNSALEEPISSSGRDSSDRIAT